jgi:hypothetical protein
MRPLYIVVKREPTTYCGLGLLDTPDIDNFPHEVLRFFHLPYFFSRVT